MSAHASQGIKHGDFIHSLNVLARALCGGSPLGADMRAAVADAVAAARWTQDGADTRITGYQVLVGRFLTSGAAQTCRTAGRAAPVYGSRRDGAAALRPQGKRAASQLLEAFRGLEPTERAALLLVAVEGLTYREAAEVMNLDAAAFVNALARAREAFAARLAASGTHSGRHLHLVD
jgi:RNA polymerase sigma-70 factor (ECF subfamily)